MPERSINHEKPQITVGMLAHVDAGKTTLSEAMLYCGGLLQKVGRVDHGDAYLDTDHMERERGITIFSKQAILPLKDRVLTLLDTPGHVDFSGEMERALQVLDYAVLVISATDGVQSHTLTVWKLLQSYHIPTFLFINKMDLAGADHDAVLAGLQKTLSPGCVDFTPAQDRDALLENIAVQDESVMDRYLDTGDIPEEEISRLIAGRRVFPCYFGSALKLTGIEELLKGLTAYTAAPDYPAEFGARVFKIARDPQGARLTYVKITGGSLKVKDLLTGKEPDGETDWQEKVDQIRLYSGARFTPADRVSAGTVCALTGLTKTRMGQGLGQDGSVMVPLLQPVMSCEIRLPEGCDAHAALMKLEQLTEEDPQLHIIWNEHLQKIQLQMMGEVQLDVLKRMISERFGMDVDFEPGKIVYKETIAAPVEGMGHFEPLRHYAEVHLLLEPLPRGSGLVFDTICSEDVLDKNWQRLILTHFAEKEHLGVLTGSPITDVKITLTNGRAHLKHTEGGDFRQATYRAIRQGLMQAQSILLEPWYTFRLEVPAEHIGRAIADVQRMGGEFDPPETVGETAVLRGKAPVSAMRGYPMEMTGYTRGKGRLSCTLCGYEPCHDQEEVVARMQYDPERDTENPADSVFCAHGAGFVVPWQQVSRYAHLESGIPEGMLSPKPQEDVFPESANVAPATPSRSFSGTLEEDAELAAIFERTYGPARRRDIFRTAREAPPEVHYEEAGPEYLLVDGYNIIFAWDELKELARTNLEAARQALADILCNYQGFRKCSVILVFDAYKVKKNAGEVAKYHNIYIVYTKEAETADMYIEKTTYQLAKHRRVRVATSDGTEQLIILGHGALRVSARVFHGEVEQAKMEIRRIIEESNRRNNRSFQKNKDRIPKN